MRIDLKMERDTFSSRYDEVVAVLSDSPTEQGTLAALARWEELRREYATWNDRSYVRFRADTSDPAAGEERRLAANIGPFFIERDNEVKRLLLLSPHRAAIEALTGAFTLARWDADIGTFAPGIHADMQEDSLLSNSYTRLIGGAAALLRGKEHTLTELGKYAEDPDRSLRRVACEASWAWFERNADELDATFDALVRTRTAIARACGYENYVELSYKRLGRIGYGPVEVAGFRDEIRDEIVPLAASFAARQAHALGLESLMPWDEEAFGRTPEMETPPDADDAMKRLRSVLRSLDPAIGAFAELMEGADRVDAASRPGKSSGAFCAFFQDDAMPFVFASYTGKARDCVTLIHEMGHAFQGFESRAYPTLEQMLPTLEICEIHSTALELLAAPYYERFFGEEAGRYITDHLRTLISRLPYMAAVDHFQQLVYEDPSASPAQRREMWLQMEATYLPWKTHGGIAALARGASWQRQRHVYVSPFYYIDYAIASCCALGLWERSLDDPQGAIASYLKLCRLGGTLPLGDLLDAVSLRSPFQRGVLTSIASRAS
jgi:M3 family oligoendopeptidase